MSVALILNVTLLQGLLKVRRLLNMPSISVTSLEMVNMEHIHSLEG